MKFRIFEIEPGRWTIDIPVLQYQPNIEDAPVPERFEGVRMLILDQTEDAEIFNCECPTQIMVDENDNVSLDAGWMENLMSLELQKVRILNKTNSKLDEELAQETPDPVELARLQRILAKLPEMTDLEVYQKSLQQLQEDGANKPTIVQKLEEKIIELS